MVHRKNLISIYDKRILSIGEYRRTHPLSSNKGKNGVIGYNSLDFFLINTDYNRSILRMYGSNPSAVTLIPMDSNIAGFIVSPESHSSNVLPVRCDSEIFSRIIKAVAVYMIYQFITRKFSAKNPLHYYTMKSVSSSFFVYNNYASCIVKFIRTIFVTASIDGPSKFHKVAINRTDFNPVLKFLVFFRFFSLSYLARYKHSSLFLMGDCYAI